MNRLKSDLHAIRIGCAGWALRKEYASQFPDVGTHLTRYADRLSVVEINSSFYRPHRSTTYAKWAASVPDGFQFAVKVPRLVTHEHRLLDTADVLDRFLSEATCLREKLGPILVQLPPTLEFSATVAESFFGVLREKFGGTVVLEPRHPSWFELEAERLATRFRVARVAADPAVVKAAATPGGWNGLVYYRLHGSPKVYYSAYSAAYLDTLSDKLSIAAKSADVWCVFDNTALGAATANALDLVAHVRTA